MAQRYTCTALARSASVGVTYIPADQGWLYLAATLDLFSRRIVGWATSHLLETLLTLDALQMAIGRRRPPVGLLYHSDRGDQYASAAYQVVLAQHGLVASMSRSGNCYDNAPLESFFSTFKTELIHPRHYLSTVTSGDPSGHRSLHQGVLQCDPPSLGTRLSQPCRV